MEKVGRYWLIELLGTGGMGEVFLAMDDQAQLVALKRLLPGLASNEDFVRMFLDEARLGWYLDHPNIARVLESGTTGNTHYMAIELVQGPNLQDVMEALGGRPMPTPMMCYVAQCICRALAYAHQACDDEGEPLQVVHRDVSPANVLIGRDGMVKMIDFGIAKARDRLTQTVGPEIKGRFAYMSPEQVRGRQVDNRSDIFSLGAVLYFICTGEQLFSGPNEFAVMMKVLEAEVRDPCRLNPDLPHSAAQVMRKALARRPGNRYQDAAELEEALAAFAETCSFGPAEMSEWMRVHFPEERRGGNLAPRVRLDTGPHLPDADPRWDSDPELVPRQQLSTGPQLPVEEKTILGTGPSYPAITAREPAITGPELPKLEIHFPPPEAALGEPGEDLDGDLDGPTIFDPDPPDFEPAPSISTLDDLAAAVYQLPAGSEEPTLAEFPLGMLPDEDAPDIDPLAETISADTLDMTAGPGSQEPGDEKKP